MIKKICQVIDGEYVCDIDISVEEWKILLMNEKVFDSKSIAALKKWFIEPSHSCTCFDIGKKYDLHSMSANGVINGLGGRVQKELGRFEVKGIGNIASGTKFITVMKSKEIGGKPKRNLWTIREELVQAIKELDFFGTTENTSNEFYSDDELVNAMEKNNNFDDDRTFEYTGKAKPKKKAIEVKNGLSYPRNKVVSKNALNKAGYRCEVDNDHPTFRRRNSPLHYTEPHHIVPMSRQDAFDTSLDVEENIISLCCNCHKQIHLGQGYEDMLEKIYNERKELLKKVDIDISLENLISYYKMESK
ncbi:TPA: HNH endonuclease [Escherichia coli]|uniref:HNH endonuclease signature motif containing protein n=1 Tax=Escherichia coli TaxID=562 RepID=UPI0007751F90|nr:HNH endonuclease [Escherichia coli]EFB3218809.1 HNH endonuclease [Escherichia coli]EFG1107328.1 HNH endonuclease [Escherichia coli]EHU9157400.1 HNH endonuclease [Escherichia coli]EJM9619647.1 HNH endonuclease [Escherichia coli]KXP64304.1 HNH endonuclease [Escherichia coli]